MISLIYSLLFLSAVPINTGSSDRIAIAIALNDSSGSNILYFSAWRKDGKVALGEFLALVCSVFKMTKKTSKNDSKIRPKTLSTKETLILKFF